MKSILTKMQLLSLLVALPVLAEDVGLHNSSAQPTRAAEKLKSYTVGACQIVPGFNNYEGKEISGGNVLDPVGYATNFLWQYEFKADGKSELEQDKIRDNLRWLEKNAQVTVLKQPTHGSIINGSGYAFSPEYGYSGKDKVVFEVKLGDYKIRLNYYVGVSVGSTDDYEAIKKFCGARGAIWKIVENYDITPNTIDLGNPRRLG